ncbi:MAG: ATP-binding protein [Planctomycetes bacterium]|nr:ATP-binding protein [Planctomycetota bacterium]
MPQTESFQLGTDRLAQPPAPVSLAPKSLLRHMMALGSSGSGKTVICKAVVEEFVRSGLPAICIDPQGDLCSLALHAKDPEYLKQKGIDPATAAAFAEKADVVLFSPASRKGVALSADPMSMDVSALPARERVVAISGMASMLASLLGYDLESDDGAGLVAVFDKALAGLLKNGRMPRNLRQFTDWLLKLDGATKEEYGRYLDVKKIEHACQKLARLDVGARRLLFHEGLALDIDLLLGRGENSAAVPGKARLSVVYLNTLNAQEDKEFFVAALVERLYAWMLENPSDAPQALFYIDEVAPFIPPVRKPASKPGLSLLFKQARKYGICCLMATQNPADVDYKAMAQFGTWAIGRLTTRQDMAKVQPTVKALDPVHVDQIMEELPALKPGQFILISPDNFSNTVRLQSRWLYTRHETLNEDAIEQQVDGPVRERFNELEEHLEAQKPEDEELPADEAEEPAPAKAGRTAKAAPLAEEDEDEEEEEPAAPDTSAAEALKEADSKLARKPSMTAAEYAAYADVGEGAARSTLRKLAAAGLAAQFKEGRVQRYFSRAAGLRPDLGLTEPVQVLSARLTSHDAERLGRDLRGKATLGIFGDDEELDHVEMEYRLVLQLEFRESVTRTLMQRVFQFDFRAADHLQGHVYLHPVNLKIAVYTPEGGVRLEDRPDDYASRVRDFDNVTTLERALPGNLRLNLVDLQNRKSDEVVKQAFSQRYKATPKKVTNLFLPVWNLHMKAVGRAETRIAAIDGLAGKPLQW